MALTSSVGEGGMFGEYVMISFAIVDSSYGWQVELSNQNFGSMRLDRRAGLSAWHGRAAVS